MPVSSSGSEAGACMEGIHAAAAAVLCPRLITQGPRPILDSAWALRDLSPASPPLPLAAPAPLLLLSGCPPPPLPARLAGRRALATRLTSRTCRWLAGRVCGGCTARPLPPPPRGVAELACQPRAHAPTMSRLVLARACVTSCCLRPPPPPGTQLEGVPFPTLAAPFTAPGTPPPPAPAPAPRTAQVPLGRRFRSLKLFFVMRMYGAERLRAYVRHHIALAAYFAGRARDDPRFEVVEPQRFGLVCFRWGRCRGGPGATMVLVSRGGQGARRGGEVWCGAASCRSPEPGAKHAWRPPPAVARCTA